jgi:sporulation protein YlmC with PRC-barrel domain
MMTPERISQRASILGTQVISKATARRLGIVTEVWLDVDQRTIMGFSVAQSFLPGTPIGFGESFYLPITEIALLGPDAILVDNETSLEEIEVSDRYTNLIGDEVVTESGELLGKVRDYRFDAKSGELFYLIISSVSSPYVPSVLISTYELDVNEIIAVGREKLIVTEGMEERLTQLNRGLLEQLGLGKPPWESDYDDDFFQPTPISGNALGSGQRSNPYAAPSYPDPYAEPTYRREETWEEEDNWAEERNPASPPPRQARRSQPITPPPPPPIEDDDYYDDDFDEEYEMEYVDRRERRYIDSSRAKQAEIPTSQPEEQPFYEQTQRQIEDAWSDGGMAKKRQRLPEEELEEL